MRFIENLVELINPYLHLNLFYSGRVGLGVGGNFIPHLIFDYVITSHQFNPIHYFTKQLSKQSLRTQDKVEELHNQG